MIGELFSGFVYAVIAMVFILSILGVTAGFTYGFLMLMDWLFKE